MKALPPLAVHPYRPPRRRRGASGWVGSLLAAVPATFMALVVETAMFVLRVTAEAAEREQEEAERATTLAKNSEQGEDAAARAARRSDPEAIEGHAPRALEGASQIPFPPTGEVPALTGIGLTSGSR